MAESNLNAYWQGTLIVLGYIGQPFGSLIYYIAIFILFLAKLLYGPIITFLQPFIYLARFVIFLVTLPYHLLAKFEPLYNFLGVAAIFGLLIGLALHYSSQKFDALPDINDYLRPYLPWLEGRTVSEYRQAKAKQKTNSHISLPSSGYASLSDSMAPTTRGKRGLSSQTILEEGDSDF